jgi:Leucine-rich repeat (LRR) protein
MKSLSTVNLVRTAIEKLPSSIDCLTALNTLNLEDCKNLKSNMDSLRSLEILVLSGCSKLANLPETVWKMKCLKKLYLNGRSRLEGIGFNGIISFSSLQYLTLSRTSFVSLPRSISQLSNLETLDLSHCLYLRSLLELPSTVKYINAQECYSLQPSHNGGRYDESSGRVAYTILHRYLQVISSLSLL